MTEFCILFVKLVEDFRGDVAQLCSLRAYRDVLALRVLLDWKKMWSLNDTFHHVIEQLYQCVWLLGECGEG